jgi:hypothetical protein
MTQSSSVSTIQRAMCEHMYHGMTVHITHVCIMHRVNKGKIKNKNNFIFSNDDNDKHDGVL